jgi:hypothetical protein
MTDSYVVENKRPKHITAFQNNTVEASPIAAAIIKFMDSRTGWIETATELHNKKKLQNL